MLCSSFQKSRFYAGYMWNHSPSLSTHNASSLCSYSTLNYSFCLLLRPRCLFRRRLGRSMMLLAASMCVGVGVDDVDVDVVLNE
jgi:hypothetical protein